MSMKMIKGDGCELETIFWKPVGNSSECAMIKLTQTEADKQTGEGDLERVRASYKTKFRFIFMKI